MLVSAFKHYPMTMERQTLINETKAAIAQIAKNDDGWGMGLVEEMIGWISNSHAHTWGDVECVIGALLPLMSTWRLRKVRVVARFHVANPHSNVRGLAVAS